MLIYFVKIITILFGCSFNYGLVYGMQKTKLKPCSPASNLAAAKLTLAKAAVPATTPYADQDEDKEIPIAVIRKAAAKAHLKAVPKLKPKAPSRRTKLIANINAFVNQETFLNELREEGLNSFHVDAQEGNAIALQAKIKIIYDAYTKNADKLYDIWSLLDRKDSNGSSPMHLAAQNGHSRIVSLLLSELDRHYKNAAWTIIKSKNNSGLNLLHLATQNGHGEVIKCILAAAQKANWPRERLVKVINCATDAGLTPLHLAAQGGYADITAALIEGISSAPSGLRVLQLAAQHSNEETLQSIIAGTNESFSQQDLVDLIYCKAQDPRMQGFILFHLAARQGHRDAVRMLLKIIQSSDPLVNTSYDLCKIAYARTPRGFTALHFAAQMGYNEIAKLLLNCLCDVAACDLMEFINCKTDDGCTALALASENGHAEVVRSIIEIVDIHNMGKLKAEEFKALILNPGCETNFSPLCLATRQGHTEIVKMLLTKMLIDDPEPVFCSPHDRLEDILISLIDNENSKIRIAIYSLTSDLIVNALKRAHERGVIVECVVDRSCWKSAAMWDLYNHGILIKTYIPKGKWRWAEKMHNKYVIFYENFDSHSFVVTGSYNFSDSAKRNEENIVVRKGENILMKFEKNFEQLQAQSSVD